MSIFGVLVPVKPTAYGRATLTG